MEQKNSVLKWECERAIFSFFVIISFRDDYLAKPVSRAAVEEILMNLASRKMSRVRSSSLASPHKDSGEFKIGEEPRVLLVEDNIVNARILSVIMKKHKFIVEVANDGKEAMQKLSENHNKFKLILMVTLP
jgi:PleD family two-component response regulator